MSDQNFHEIQLSGKQLFFFFMCAVVVAAVIFLLGVSVGRDFRTAPIQTAQVGAEPEPAPPLAAPPPATETAPNELSYAQALQGGDPAKVAPPAPPPEQPSSPPARRDGAAASAQTAAPVSPPAPVTRTESPAAETPKAVAKAEPPKSEPARSDASKSQATKAAPARTEPPKSTPAAKSESSAPSVDATGEFSLQMGAFNTEAAATSMIANLKRRGYSASLVTLPEKTDVRFRVYVGPYRTRVDAQRAQGRLEKEGFKSLIRR